jgi:hypothetical protein
MLFMIVEPFFTIAVVITALILVVEPTRKAVADAWNADAWNASEPYHHLARIIISIDVILSGSARKPNQRRLVGQRAQREISFGAYRDIPRLVGSDDSDDSDDLYRDIPQLVSSSSDEDAYASDDEDAADS